MMRAIEEPTMTLATIGRTIAPVRAALALLLCLAAAPAQAQLARTFVSNAGNDLNDCNRFTPCRTFQRAHDNTFPLGEITVLDPGGYGAVTIDRAISIINDGVGEAGVLVSGGAVGITVNAGATDAVSLRGLTVKGIGFGGGNGIVFNSGGSLTVENCAIRTLTGIFPLGNGLVFQPNASSHLAVKNTIASDNENEGIRVSPTGAGSVTASLSRVQLVNNEDGLSVSAGRGVATATVNAVVADSIAVRNGFGVLGRGFGILTNGPAASLMVVRSLAAHNGIGVSAQNFGAILRLGGSTISGNGTSAGNIGGVIRSYGDNRIFGNADGDPPITTIPRK
jgi:hypothetical protein